MHPEEQHRYHALGPDYFWFAGKRRLTLALLQHHLARYPSPPHRRRILDVGCGPGHDSRDLNAVGDVYGLDASFTALQLYRDTYGTHDALVCADGERFPFRDASFDLIVLYDVLEHVDDDVAALQNCRRVLKPNGHILLTVPAFQWLWGEHDTMYGHKRRYTTRDVATKLREAGFVADRVNYIESIFTLPLFAWRRFKGFLPPSRRTDDFVRPPRWLNTALTALIASEVGWLTFAPMPFGVSIIAIARLVT